MRCSDAEALQVVFDPEKVTYRQLLEFFYKMHDPTTVNRQGPDVGSQYRSAIFYHSEEQEKIAKDVTSKVNAEWWKDKVATKVLPAGEWWDAEKYHQRYLDNSKLTHPPRSIGKLLMRFIDPSGYECPSHFIRKFTPLSE
jgi:peptide-methionine (S)-S-oxide reductase